MENIIIKCNNQLLISHSSFISLFQVTDGELFSLITGDKMITPIIERQIDNFLYKTSHSVVRNGFPSCLYVNYFSYLLLFLFSNGATGCSENFFIIFEREGRLCSIEHTETHLEYSMIFFCEFAPRTLRSTCDLCELCENQQTKCFYSVYSVAPWEFKFYNTYSIRTLFGILLSDRLRSMRKVINLSLEARRSTLFFGNLALYLFLCDRLRTFMLMKNLLLLHDYSCHS